MSIAILYATVTGNAEALALWAGHRLRAAGRVVAVYDVAEFPAARLAEVSTALIIASTWGEGAPPPDAEDFCAALAQAGHLRLAHLRYAVFALGSSTYKEFCGCGRRIDADLARCAAARLLPCAESGTRFKAPFERWLAQLETRL